METLPREILNEVLEWLPLQNRIQTRLVSKKFRDATPSFQLENPLLVKEKVTELDGFVELSRLQMPHMHSPYFLPQRFSFEIIYDDYLHKNTIVRISMDRGSNGLTHVCREFVKDKDHEFILMDDVDGVQYFEGIKKLYCNIRDLLKITIKRRLYLTCNGHLLDCYTSLHRILTNPNLEMKRTMDHLSFLLTEEDLDWVNQSWNTSYAILKTNLDPVFCLTKKKEELTNLIWLYLFQ